MEYLPRTIEPIIKAASEQFKVVMVTGMRQVGKSTLLQHLADDNRKIVALNKRTGKAASSDPVFFFRQNPAPAVIDEIQFAPALFDELKTTVDSSDDMGQYWITGSQQLQLMSGVADRLPGRLLQFNLFPFSIYEREGLGLQQKPYIPSLDCIDIKRPHPLKRKTQKETWEAVFRGGWPRLYANKTRLEWILQSIVRMYVEVDVREILKLDKDVGFEKFLSTLAACSGLELDISEVACTVGVSQATIKRWIRIAVITGLIWLIPAFSGNIKKQLRKKPRLYMVDTGLLAYLLGLRTPKEMKDHQNSGRFFETFVVMEIVKSWIHNGRFPDFSYYRDNQGHEIDLIMKVDGKYHCVEIKSSPENDCHATKWIRNFQEAGLPMGMSSLINMTESPELFTSSIIAHSIWDI